MRRAEEGANILGVFRVKNHYFTQKNHSFYNYGGRREKLWGISCEKSRFYAKKTYFFPILGGGGGAPGAPPLDPPLAMEFASEPYLYADDTKICKEIYKTRDCEDLQKDMHLMHAWSEKWILKFHPDKCKTMRIGRSKVEKHEYTL